jgi:hypothetical protein
MVVSYTQCHEDKTEIQEMDVPVNDLSEFVRWGLL